MFRLTFILLAAIGVTMLVVGDKSNTPQVAAVQPRLIDPALVAKPRSTAPAEEVVRPASVDRLLGVEPRPATSRPVAAQAAPLGSEAPEAVVELASAEGVAPPPRREFLSVNDEIAARAMTQAERAAAIAAAESGQAAVAEGVAAAMADATVARVTGNRVNVRSGPSTDYAVVGQVVQGDLAEVISQEGNGWALIRIQGDGVEGYIASRFLDGSGLGN